MATYQAMWESRNAAVLTDGEQNDYIITGEGLRQREIQEYRSPVSILFT
jgi:hypothetical protein